MNDLLSAIHSRPTDESGREKKTLNVIRDDLTIGQYVGWNCGPNNPDDWWCPDYGYSVHIGQGAFEDICDAKHEATLRIDRELSRLLDLWAEMKGTS